MAVGAADTAAALFAAGLRADEAMLNLGSGGQWVVLEDAVPAGATPPTSTGPSAAATTAWPRCRTWASPSTGCATSSARPGKSSTTRPPARAAPDAPRFDPYLSPERWNPAATGAWTGLTLAHEREDLMRSALDGVAGLLRQRLDDLRAAGHAPQRVILGGGGTTSPAWRALLAQTLDLPLRDASASWLTPTGAARLAAALR